MTFQLYFLMMIRINVQCVSKKKKKKGKKITQNQTKKKSIKSYENKLQLSKISFIKQHIFFIYKVALRFVKNLFKYVIYES